MSGMQDKKKPSVAFLGPPSSYSHQAALECFDEKIYDFNPQTHISDIFGVVQDGAVTRGVVPFENSSNGSVVFTLDLFAERQRSSPDVFVCGEAYLDVHHCLLGYKTRRAVDGTNAISSKDGTESGDATPTAQVPQPGKPRAQPLSDLSHIEHIYSHPQAFGQCELFLSTYLRSAKRYEVSSTSRAAEIVATGADKPSAAISSKVAAQVHKLDILGERIEDREDNTTRFLILKRKQPGITAEVEGPCKSLVSFTIDHLLLGALAEALLVFKSQGLNLTSINSRPSWVAPWTYIFFVEFAAPDSDAVQSTLTQLGKVSTGYRWLGSWKDQLKR